MVGKHCGVAFAQNPPIEGMCPEIATQIDVIETACYGVRIARGTRPDWDKRRRIQNETI